MRSLAVASVAVAAALAHRAPLVFTWPTSVDVVSKRSLLVVANGSGKVLRVDPSTGRTTVLFRVPHAYSGAHIRGGGFYLSTGAALLRVDAAGNATTVATSKEDIGPVALAPNGDLYYSTETQVFRVAGGSGTPTRLAGGLSGPHGIAVTADGGLLVADTGHRRVDRIDLKTGHVELWRKVGNPRGIGVAGDGTVYVVDAGIHRVLHLMADGRSLASPKHVFGDPYALSVAADGSVYVVDTSVSGRLYRIAPNGATTPVSRPAGD